MGKEIETLRSWHQVYVLTFAASGFDRKLKEKYRDDSRYDTVAINRWTRLFHVIAVPWMPNYFAARSSFRFAWKLIWAVRRHKIDVIRHDGTVISAEAERQQRVAARICGLAAGENSEKRKAVLPESG